MLLLLIVTASVHGLEEPWERWTPHDPSSTQTVDHSAWTKFLQTYVITDTDSGVNLVGYAEVTPGDRRSLSSYIAMLERTPDEESRR